MSWTESTPGIWKRELGGLEKVYRFASQSFKHIGQEQWLLHTICAVNFGQNVDIVAALRAGWKDLLLDFPGLLITVEGYEAFFRPQTLTDPQMLHDFLEKTFVVERARSAEDVIPEYQLREWPTLVFLQASSEVMLLTSHWRVDAIGCCLLLDRLFRHVARQLSGSTNGAVLTLPEDYVAKLSPSMEDAAAAPQSASQEIMETAGKVTGGFREAAMKTLGFNYKGDRTTAPGASSCESLVLTAASSQGLIDACKKRGGISVSAAAYAALAATLFRYHQQENGGSPAEFTTIMAVNMRTHLPAPFNETSHACAAYVTSITPKVEKDENFGASSASITQEFKLWHSDAFNAALREIYQRASGALIKGPPGPPGQGPPPPPPSGITLSSLGIINKLITGRYGESKTSLTESAINVTGFTFGVSMYSRQMLLYLWTFDGRIHLSVNYNQAYYDASTPRGLLDGIYSVLEQELDVKMQLQTGHMQP